MYLAKAGHSHSLLYWGSQGVVGKKTQTGRQDEQAVMTFGKRDRWCDWTRLTDAWGGLSIKGALGLRPG